MVDLFHGKTACRCSSSATSMLIQFFIFDQQHMGSVAGSVRMMNLIGPCLRSLARVPTTTVPLGRSQRQRGKVVQTTQNSNDWLARALPWRGSAAAGTPMAGRDTTFIEITPDVLLKAYACGIFPDGRERRRSGALLDRAGTPRHHAAHRVPRAGRASPAPCAPTRCTVHVNRDFDGRD